jgi:hypothetical protein
MLEVMYKIFISKKQLGLRDSQRRLEGNMPVSTERGRLKHRDPHHTWCFFLGPNVDLTKIMLSYILEQDVDTLL